MGLRFLFPEVSACVTHAGDVIIADAHHGVVFAAAIRAVRVSKAGPLAKTGCHDDKNNGEQDKQDNQGDLRKED